MGDRNWSDRTIGGSQEDRSVRERSLDRGEGHRGDDRRQQQGRRDDDDKHRTARHLYHGFGDRRRSRSRSPSNKRGSMSRDYRRRERGGGGGGGGGGDHYRRSRSRSRERRRNSVEKDRHRTRRSNSPRDRRNRKSRSRSRDRPRYRKRPQSHSQSRSPDYCRSRPLGGTQKTTNSSATSAAPPNQNNVEEDSKTKSEDFSNEKLSNLPLKDPMQLIRSGHIVTAQMAVQQTMAAMNARAQQLTGVQLPKYYNPAAVNPMKYAEQMQKRKLLWQNKEKKETVAPSTNHWETTTFSQDQDGKMAAKFKKLMGIKEEGVGGTSDTTKVVDSDPNAQDHIRKQEELFRTLDQQYEVARISTHTQRGVGLGFSSSAPIQIPHIFPK